MAINDSKISLATRNAAILKLMELPPEIILRIASHLPLRALLTFSSTCRYSRELSTRSLHSLAFGIYATWVARHISVIEDLTSLKEWLPVRSSMKVDVDNTAAVVLPHDSGCLDLSTMLAFHDALHSSILNRYAAGLRVLELSLWRLNHSVAESLRCLKGLQSLSVRIHAPFAVRSVAGLGRGSVEQQEGAWAPLAEAWQKLEILRLESAAITAHELGGILKSNPSLDDMRLKKCPAVKEGFFDMLASWQGSSSLRYLGLIECGQVSLADLDPLRAMHNLQFLSLLGCTCTDPEAFRGITMELGHIETFHPPKALDELQTADFEIEIDPDPSSSLECLPFETMRSIRFEK